jgi:hypothetical protein
MKEIPLTQGYVALVDDADFDWINQWKWHSVSNHDGSIIYAQRNTKANGKPTKVAMHRLVILAPAGLFVDHIDHNGLNNTRANLRLCTRSQNLANGRRHRTSVSQFKGVSRHSRGDKWQAQIRRNGKVTGLGTFYNEIDAARAYDRAALEEFGEFAFTNFPQESEV